MGPAFGPVRAWAGEGATLLPEGVDVETERGEAVVAVIGEDVAVHMSFNKPLALQTIDEADSDGAGEMVVTGPPVSDRRTTV